MWVNLGGIWQRRRLRIKVCVVSGDQKSQDYICGRMSINEGNAGCIHRGCMTSVVNSTDVGENGVLSGGCRKPVTDVLTRLNEMALLNITDDDSGLMSVVVKLLPAEDKKQIRLVSAQLNRTQRLAKDILNKVFSMHPHRNAFKGIDFGANPNGILVAATEDHLHLGESGLVLNLGEVAYGGLTPGECTETERIICLKVTSSKSSISSEYPRGTVKSNFGRLTLCSHKEKVGAIFYLLLALHDKRGREVIGKAHKRQQKKYITFPTKKADQKLSSETKKSSYSNGKPRKKWKVSSLSAAPVGTEPPESECETDDD